MSIIKIMGVGELPGMVDYLLTAAFIFLILELTWFFTSYLFLMYCITIGALIKYLTHRKRKFEKDPIKIIPFLSSEKFMQKMGYKKIFTSFFWLFGFGCFFSFFSRYR